MMAGALGYSFRTRSLLIGAVYFLYFVAVGIALGIGVNHEDAVRPGLIVMITVASLHFGLGLYGTFVEGRRVSLPDHVQDLVDVADWLMAAGLGLACGAVNRTCGDNTSTLIATAVLLLVGNSVCAYKTFFFVQERYYDQATGERM